MFGSTANQKEPEDKSLDFRLTTGFHAFVMVVLVLHFVFGAGVIFEATTLGLYALIAVVISLRNRKKLGFRWPGIRVRDALGTIVAMALVIFFSGAILPGNSPFSPVVFPFLAAGFNFLVFAALSGMKIVYQNQEDFLRHCGPDAAALSPQPEPTAVVPKPSLWKRTLGCAFGIYFLVVWIGAILFFWHFNYYFSRGSPTPTATQTEKLTNHGHLAYITAAQHQRLDWLDHCMIFGIPSAILLAFVVRAVAGKDAFGVRT